jgi:hypothetical protein
MATLGSITELTCAVAACLFFGTLLAFIALMGNIAQLFRLDYPANFLRIEYAKLRRSTDSRPSHLTQ